MHEAKQTKPMYSALMMTIGLLVILQELEL